MNNTHSTALSEEQAFLAMYLFLDGHYRLTKSDDIGGLLSMLSFLQDGTTVDEALWNDWLRAVNRVLKDNLTKYSSEFQLRLSR